MPHHLLKGIKSMNKDDNEIIKLSCPKCGMTKEGTYYKLFGDLPSLKLLPKLVCKNCNEILCLEFVNN